MQVSHIVYLGEKKYGLVFPFSYADVEEAGRYFRSLLSNLRGVESVEAVRPLHDPTITVHVQLAADTTPFTASALRTVVKPDFQWTVWWPQVFTVHYACGEHGWQITRPIHVPGLWDDVVEFAGIRNPFSPVPSPIRSPEEWQGEVTGRGIWLQNLTICPVATHIPCPHEGCTAFGPKTGWLSTPFLDDFTYRF